MRSGAVRVFPWRGIETRLHWSLLVIASLLTWSLTGNAGGYSTAAQWVAAVLAAAAFAASIIGHKLGHSMSTRHVLDNVTVGDVMTPHPAMVPDTMTLATLVGCVLQKIQGSTVPVVRDGRLVGLITPDHLRRVAPGQWSFLTTADIATPVDAVATARAAEPLLDALDRVAIDERRIVVVDDDDASHVVGLITPTDLARAVRLTRLREAAPPDRAVTR